MLILKVFLILFRSRAENIFIIEENDKRHGPDKAGRQVMAFWHGNGALEKVLVRQCHESLDHVRIARFKLLVEALGKGTRLPLCRSSASTAARPSASFSVRQTSSWSQNARRCARRLEQGGKVADTAERARHVFNDLEPIRVARAAGLENEFSKIDQLQGTLVSFCKSSVTGFGKSRSLFGDALSLLTE